MGKGGYKGVRHFAPRVWGDGCRGPGENASGPPKGRGGATLTWVSYGVHTGRLSVLGGEGNARCTAKK